MSASRPQRSRLLPVRSLAPNILTVLAICAGMTSIRMSLAERWDLAVFAIIVAAVLDALDGRLARLLKGATKFGAELDSLSDFVNFGVAPVLLLYLWTLQELGGLGWVIVLAFSVCCALRLARFNTALDDPDQPAWNANFFTGVPAPAAAMLCILPVMLSFLGAESLFRIPVFSAVFASVVAFLMVSRVPTYSFKRLKVKREFVLPILLLVGLTAAVGASYPWEVLVGAALLYLCSIPFSIVAYRRHVVTQALVMPPRDTAGPGEQLEEKLDSH